MPGNPGPSTKLVQPKTKRGRRELERRAPKLVEDPKRALLLYGNRTSQVVKDVLTDLRKLKWGESVKLSRKNEDARPFEPGGEAPLERLAARADCQLFALGTHSKKRPHNLVLGRLYDGHLFDTLELGVARCEPTRGHGAAAGAQVGNKPAFVFAGDGFGAQPALRLARSLLLDFFRGREVAAVNLAGVDRVVLVTHRGADTLLLRQYHVRLKKSGTKVPRVALADMGPSLDLELRRHRLPPAELEKEAMRRPKELKKKKEKNVGSDVLEGKVGRIYLPRQDLAAVALKKPKGLKRERREAAEARTAAGNAGAKRAKAAVLE